MQNYKKLLKNSQVTNYKLQEKQDVEMFVIAFRHLYKSFVCFSNVIIALKVYHCFFLITYNL
jgi:hypothetical protein